MKKRYTIYLVIIIISVIVLGGVWYYSKHLMKADIVNNTNLPTAQVPAAINFIGHINVAGVMPNKISIVIKGQAFAVNFDGNFTALVSRGLFLDSNKKPLPVIAVDFWDLSQNVRYQESDNHEQFMLTLPQEWQPSGMVVYSGGSGSSTYRPSAAFQVKRDFNLLRVN